MRGVRGGCAGGGNSICSYSGAGTESQMGSQVGDGMMIASTATLVLGGGHRMSCRDVRGVRGGQVQGDGRIGCLRRLRGGHFLWLRHPLGCIVTLLIVSTARNLSKSWRPSEIGEMWRELRGLISGMIRAILTLILLDLCGDRAGNTTIHPQSRESLIPCIHHQVGK